MEKQKDADVRALLISLHKQGGNHSGSASYEAVLAGPVAFKRGGIKVLGIVPHQTKKS